MRGERRAFFYLKVIVIFPRACYNGDMHTRRFAGALLAAAIAATGIFGTLGAALPEVAFADGENATELTTENADLFLPASYEQYLDMASPSHLAMSEHYVAIADGKTLYVYDRAQGEYSSYEHNGDTNIYMVQFTEEEQLFFSDVGWLYTYDLDAGEAKVVDNVPCNTFLIDGNDLFVSSSSGNIAALRHYKIENNNGEITATGRQLIHQIEQTSIPMRLTSDGGNLYCIVNDTSFVTFDLKTLEKIDDYSFLNRAQGPVSGLQFVCAYRGDLYYTVNNPSFPFYNGIYRSKNEAAVCLLEGNGFSAIVKHGGKLYGMQNTSAHELVLSDDGNSISFGDYEISAASASLGRLSGARDIARAKNLLVTADAANARISVYDFSTNTFSEIPAPFGAASFAPSLVATDGKLIAFASGSTVWTYEYGSNATPVAVDAADEVKGIVCVYGTCYYVTQHRLGNATKGEWRSSGDLSPTALTSDVYGNIYITEGQNVYRCAERDFFLSGTKGEPYNEGWTLPARFTSLCADFEGSLYYLDGDKALCKNGEKLAYIDGGDFVYSPAATEPVSFALGFEDDAVYFLFGDYVVRSRESGDGFEGLGFPTLSTISAEGVYDSVFQAHDDISLCDIADGAVSIRVDLTDLTAESAYFDYERYLRTDKAQRGVLLTELHSGALDYLLVAVNDRGSYSLNLFLKSACTEVLPKVGEGGWWTEETRTLYTLSKVNAYYFPCLSDALKTGGTLARGTRVTLLATVKGDLGYDFAYIEFSGDMRGTVRGYVPLSVLTEHAPFAPENAEYRLAYLKASEDGVTFYDEAGNEYVIYERTQMRFYANGDGTFTARYSTEDGTLLTATVRGDMIDNGESNAWRTALIIGLSVLALVIIGAYVYLRPWQKKKTK